MNPRRRLAGIAVVAAVAMIGLAGCGGGGAADSGDEKTSSEPLTIFKNNPHNLTQVGAEAALELGYFKKAGLNVELTISKQVLQSMAAGNADIGISSVTEVAGAIMNGLEATIVGSAVNDWDKVLLVSPDSKATSFEDLKGETFGVTSVSSSGGYVTAKLADKYGWTDKDYKMVSLRSLDSIVAALKNKTIAAFLWSPQAAVPLEEQGAAKNLGNIKDLIDPAPNQVLFVRNDVIKDRAADVKKFMDTYFQVIKDFHADRSLAEKLYVDNWGSDPEETRKVLDASLPGLSEDGRIDESLFEPSVEATKFLIPNAKAMTVEDFKKMYRYWGDL